MLQRHSWKDAEVERVRRGTGPPCPPRMSHPEEPWQVLFSGSQPTSSLGFFTSEVASALLTGPKSMDESNRPGGETQGGPSARVLDSLSAEHSFPSGKGKTSAGMGVLWPLLDKLGQRFLYGRLQNRKVRENEGVFLVFTACLEERLLNSLLGGRGWGHKWKSRSEKLLCFWGLK